MMLACITVTLWEKNGLPTTFQKCQICPYMGTPVETLRMRSSWRVLYPY
jgi:hypothetical protein